MGELLRRFWIPVLLSDELPEAERRAEKDRGDGEELLAFRDTRGVVGVIDRYCPHRGANLWLGRNEECGIRCVYHGWKFDTDGACVDMPTSYPDLNAKDKIRIKSYPAREWGEMIWAYMARRMRCRTCQISKWRWCRHRIATSPRNGRTATGCRRWKVRSTPHISPSPSLLRKGRERDPRHQAAFRESADRGSRPTTCAGSPRTRAP